ncbi:MAG: hypothetical protein ACKVVT_19760 [Dehalococcoidia bacterium]
MSNRRPERIYGIVVRDHQLLLTEHDGRFGLPGGIFRPLAEDPKVELAVHLFDQIGIRPTRIWAQGAFLYQHPSETSEAFSGFYTVWDWDGVPTDDAGHWIDKRGLLEYTLSPSLRILLLSVLETEAIKTR